MMICFSSTPRQAPTQIAVIAEDTFQHLFRQIVARRHVRTGVDVDARRLNGAVTRRGVSLRWMRETMLAA